MAREVTITVRRGEAVIIPFAAKVSDAVGADALNITGKTLTLTVVRRHNSTTKVIATITCTVTNGASGLYRAALTAAMTLALVPATYFWDTWITNSGEERMLGYGDFVVGPAARVPTA